MAQLRLPCLASIALRSVAAGWVAAIYGGLYIWATADFAQTGSLWIFGWPFALILTAATVVHLLLAGIAAPWVPSPIPFVRTINAVLDPRGEPQAPPREQLAQALAWLPSVPAADTLVSLVLGGVSAFAMAMLEQAVSGSARNVLPIAYGGVIATLLYGSTTFIVTELMVSRPCQRLRLAGVRRGLDPYSGDAVGTWIRVVTLAAPAVLALVVTPSLHLPDLWQAKVILVLLASCLCGGLAALQAFSIRMAAADLGLAASRLTGKEPALFITGTIDAHLVAMARAFNVAASDVDRSLQISAARYSALFEGAGDGILIVDAATGRVLEANRRAHELTGHGEAALKARTFESLFHPGSNVSGARHEPGAYRWQHGGLVVRADGTTCPVDVAVSLVMVQDQTLLQAILHDVSERERIESQLRESVDRLEGLYHLAVTLGGTVQQVAEHVATTLAGLLDVPLVAVERHDGEVMTMLAMWEDGLRTPEAPIPLAGTPCERVRQHRRPCVFTDAAASFPGDAFLVERGVVSYLGVPVIGRTGDVLGVVAVMDTRERVPREQDMRLLTAFAQRLARALEEEAFAREREAFVRQLIESDRLKSEFMGMMSHELRTPLNIFIGYTELLLDASREDARVATLGEHRDVLERMLEAGCVLANLVEDTLSVLRLESAGVRVQREALALGALFDELRAAERFLRAPSNVREEWQVEADLPMLVSDRLKLRQVLTNLVGNARKFTAQGNIAVRAFRATPETVEIEVADTGCGIAAAELPFVFDLYRQAANGGTHNGCGIGLYIVRRYCELLGGRVEVESEVGRGTRFRVTLPVAADPALAERRTAVAG